MNKVGINKDVRAKIIIAVTSAQRPIETRAFVKRIARRVGTTQWRVWGNISCLKRRGAISFPVAVPGGKSYISL